MGDDLVSTLLSVSSWVNMVLELGVAVAAFARLRTSPAGLLIGLGFLTLLGISLASQVLWMVGQPTAADLDAMAAYERLGLINSALGVCSSVVLVVVGVGTLLIPRSLAKREGGTGAV